ncbi:helix-turn-helix family protein, partial [Vibrio cholerae HC-41A1]|jgi:chorismate mutase / prephenate dehydratase
MSEDI